MRTRPIFRSWTDRCQTLVELWPSLAAVETKVSAWGDEVEYLVLLLDHEAQDVHVSTRTSQILSGLKERYPDECFDPEAYKYMLESQPRRPYDDSLQDLARVESNMRDRCVKSPEGERYC